MARQPRRKYALPPEKITLATEPRQVTVVGAPDCPLWASSCSTCGELGGITVRPASSVPHERSEAEARVWCEKLAKNHMRNTGHDVLVGYYLRSVTAFIRS